MSIFGMNILPRIEVDQEKTFSVSEVDAIQVDLSTYPLHIIQTAAGSPVKFHLYGKASQEVELVTDLNQKTVMMKVKHQYLHQGWNDLYVDIYLPVDYEKDLAVEISTGKVTLDAMTLKNFTLHTSTGGLEAADIIAENTDIRSSTGSITIKSLQSDTLNLRASTGSISIDSCRVKNANVVATTGSINLKNCSGDFEVESSTGSVRLDFAAFDHQNLRIKTTTGRILAQLPVDAEFTLQANTSTGNIQSGFPINSVSSHAVSAQIGTGENEVTLKTTTGDISLVKK